MLGVYVYCNNMIGDGNPMIDFNQITKIKSELSTHEQKQSYLIQLYDTVGAIRFLMFT